MTPRRCELSDFESSVIEPLLPNKPRGVPRTDIPERYGPATTCYNRFVRWAKIGV
jgi:transposase